MRFLILHERKVPGLSLIKFLTRGTTIHTRR